MLHAMRAIYHTGMLVHIYFIKVHLYVLTRTVQEGETGSASSQKACVRRFPFLAVGCRRYLLFEASSLWMGVRYGTSRCRLPSWDLQDDMERRLQLQTPARSMI